MNTLEKINAVELARFFHDSYERLAPEYDYQTKEDTREFSEKSSNGKLMIAVCNDILERLLIFSKPLESKNA